MSQLDVRFTESIHFSFRKRHDTDTLQNFRILLFTKYDLLTNDKPYLIFVCPGFGCAKDG